jgi:uncharacterized protein (TIGR03067 family)
MRVVMLLVLSGMTLSLSAAPAPLPKPKRAEGDLRQIQGEWVLVEEGDKKVSDGQLTLSITGNRIRVRKGARDEGEEFSFTLDPRKFPKEIDLHVEGTTILRGIYRLSGEVFVLCCHAKPRLENIRPTDFSVANTDLLTYRRKTP